MKRREADVSKETALPVATSGAKDARGTWRKEEALAHRRQQNVLNDPASKTPSRVYHRVAFLVVVVLLVAACLASAGCGPDLGRLAQEAVGLMGSGRYDEALPIQERIAALDSGDAQIRIELGFNYLNHQNDPAGAARVFREAVDLEPSAKNMTFLAQAYIGSDDSVSAETILRQAIKAERSYGHSYAVLVSLLEKQGRVAEATALRDAAESAGVTLALNEGQ
jgi:tetratricopeptide (TPR) repeat protein